MKMTPPRPIAAAFLLSALLLAGGTASAAPAAPASTVSDPAGKQIETFQAALLDTMKHAKELGVQGRFKKLAPAIDAAFDFAGMSATIVGPAWAAMSQADRKAIVDAFRRTTIASYAKNFDGYNGEQFVTNPRAQVRGGEKIVSAELTRPGKSPIPFVYRLDNVNGVWKIDDIYQNGYISEVATKRSEFASTLKSGGATALAQKLNARADALLSGG